MTRLKAAVIGAGSMGLNHARIYSELDSVDLVGVVDPVTEAAVNGSRGHRAAVFSNCHDLFKAEAPDIASITVPTALHEPVALEAISYGTNVLVEKPLAPSLDAGRRIIEAAHAEGVKLSVGHVERFNPAVMEMKRRLDAEELGRVFQVNARRLSPFPNRIGDVGVILDLATHDIDVMRDLLGSDLRHVFAETDRKAHALCEDLLSALLRFSNGVIGVLDVNWLTPTKVRQLAVLGEGGMYLADYLTQDLFWYKNAPATGTWEPLSIFRGAREGDMIKVRINKEEPLRAELDSFVNAVTQGHEPVVSGSDGLAAIDIGLTLIESGQRGLPLAPRLMRETT